MTDDYDEPISNTILLYNGPFLKEEKISEMTGKLMSCPTLDTSTELKLLYHDFAESQYREVGNLSLPWSFFTPELHLIVDRRQCRSPHVGVPGYRPPKVISTRFSSARN